MRIAVVSDTHLYQPSPWLADVYERHLAGVDALLHCGDMTGPSLWSWFMQHPNFHAVAGNMDDWNLSAELERTVTVRLEAPSGPLTVGMAHGFGYHKRPLWRDVAESFGPGFDLICFGHTHEAAHHELGATTVVNPGCLQQRPGASLALIDVGPDNALDVSFISLEG